MPYSVLVAARRSQKGCVGDAVSGRCGPFRAVPGTAADRRALRMADPGAGVQGSVGLCSGPAPAGGGGAATCPVRVVAALVRAVGTLVRVVAPLVRVVVRVSCE